MDGCDARRSIRSGDESSQSGEHPATVRSRGHLVADYLRSRLPPSTYAASVAAGHSEYNGFNLRASNRDAMWDTAGLDGAAELVAPGADALSNARLDTPWPKAKGLCAVLSELLLAKPDDDGLVSALFEALADTTIPPDASLPETGVSLERERMLAARKIVAPGYGTRSSSVLLLRDDGSMRFDEVAFDAAGVAARSVCRSIAATVKPAV